MGMFDFVKSVGEKLGVGENQAPEAKVLKSALDALGLGTDKVDVDVEGDKVVLKGEVAEQSAFEKAIVAVGNTLGISRVEAQELKVSDSGTTGKEPVFYTVKSGDNLWKIAEANYGQGKGGNYTLIFDANKPMLSDPDKIYPGQVLRIPELKD
ncbi:hypothetical protein BJB45_10580 [Halomonas huangheensis]|uniref:Peptidoglycan-binding protein LysM n=2 Tax=Halomonas huangheensis TaxID=1178482 RepID=W1NA83_9GAMM|nr:peptidoglycan-binding protein LysM [Halomonas huangheensis]ALM53688.1 peptidoglycan-binding protein LysM [Halomonas huangheensis]ERL52403.1 hypothetical protein BJB45_10580 [Halomonas huangheensis]